MIQFINLIKSIPNTSNFSDNKSYLDKPINMPNINFSSVIAHNKPLVIFPIIGEHSKTLSLLSEENFADIQFNENDVTSSDTILPNNVMKSIVDYKDKRFCVMVIKTKIIFNPYFKNFCLLMGIHVLNKQHKVKESKYLFVHNIEPTILFENNIPMSEDVIEKYSSYQQYNYCSTSSHRIQLINILICAMCSLKELLNDYFVKQNLLFSLLKMTLINSIYEMGKININNTLPPLQLERM